MSRLSGVPYAALPAGMGPGLAQPPRLVVIHDTSNNASASDEAHYAATRTDGNKTSAHFYVDARGPLGSCPLDMQAWAAYSYANDHGWHVEMCGYNAGQPGAPLPPELDATAAIVARLCQLGGIPIQHVQPGNITTQRGICGHWDITRGLGVGTHNDPGPAFDWSGFLARVQSHAGGSPVPPPSPSTGGWDMAQFNNLVRGATGWEVRGLQGLLNAQGSRDSNGNTLAEDGNFGPLTESAVRGFQSAHGLSVDGEAGPHTRTFLNTGHDL